MLEIKNLRVEFTGRNAAEAVRGISLRMEEGETLGLVGESGSGKTVTALSVAGLLRGELKLSGEMNFMGRDLVKLSGKELRQIQGKDIGMIFQEPMTSLNPLLRVGPQVEEAWRRYPPLPPSPLSRPYT